LHICPPRFEMARLVLVRGACHAFDGVYSRVRPRSPSTQRGSAARSSAGALFSLQ
jgi:hypothetical protein